ncbi:MAG: CbiX/SirB N-terminal domain-containing protein [Pseudomonadota bacterium]
MLTQPEYTAAHALLIVSHGAPSAPEGQEAHIHGLAESTAELMPGWQVEGATLAAKGALATALDRIEAPHVHLLPLFMSDGWFVSTALPRRLPDQHRGRITILPPLGRLPGMRQIALAAIEGGLAGLTPDKTTVLLAGHGSPSDPRPALAAEAIASFLRGTGRFRAVRTGFVDQDTRLANAARIYGPAICLPFFAIRAGHVEIDLPEALEEAGFTGPVLDPIGLHPDVPALMAETALTRTQRSAA